MLKFYGFFHEIMLDQLGDQPTSKEWVGLYIYLDDELREWIIIAGYRKDFRFALVQFSAEFMGTIHRSLVG